MNKKNYNKMRGAYFLMIFLFITHIFVGWRNAPPQGRTGAPGEGKCTDCHGGNNAQGLDGSLMITGLPAEVMPNTTYRVSVEVANPNGLSRDAGMQMVALDSNNGNAGAFANPSMGARVNVSNSNGRNYLEHNPSQIYDNNRVSTFSVDWTSPADPDPLVTFYAVGNITDMGSGSDTANDLILFETQTTEVAGMVMMDLPDLTASNVTGFSGTYAPDDVAEFSWDLNNLGNVVAIEGYRIVMYLSNDNVFSTDDVEVGEVPTGNTYPGTIPSVPGAIRIPLNYPDGDYFMHLVVDNDNTVEESNEDNNIFTTSTTIRVETLTILPLEATIIQSVGCDGFGFLQCVAGEGVSPYTYQWSTGDTGASIETTSSGAFTVTVTDDTGAEVVESVSLFVPQVLELDLNIIALPGCSTLGIVEVLVSGGTGEAEYNWSDGRTGVVNTELLEGTHSVEVIDEAGCSSSISFDLEASDDLVVNAMVFQLNCPGIDDAIISLSVNGGSGNTSFQWSTGEDSDTIEDLPAGNYSVTVTSGDCSFSETYVITEISDFELIAEVDNLDCVGDMNGMISVFATGGVGPYLYEWSNGEFANNISGLSAGFYTVTINDSNGCEYEEVFNLEEPAVLEVEIIAQAIDCFGAMNGEIDVLVTGGVPPYSYSWVGGTLGPNQDGLAAGEYSFTITDANGCEVSSSVEIVEPEEIVLDAVVTYAPSNGGSIDLTVIGGEGPYEFTWTNGANTEDISDLGVGVYMVVVTDINGCIVSQEFEIISTSVSKISELISWEVYPTIVDNILNITTQFDKPVSLNIGVVNLEGKYFEVPFTPFKLLGFQQKSTVDVSQLTGGIYMLILESDNGREVRRFVKS